MSTDNTATARENARTTNGQFGTQEHSEPETILQASPRIGQVLSALAGLRSRDIAKAEREAMDARVQEFAADAQANVPSASVAVFEWREDEYDDDPGRQWLVFSHYLDADGAELDISSYPDIVDFSFDERSEAQEHAFESADDSATLHFSNVPPLDEAKARAELAIGTRFEDHPSGRLIRELLSSTMNTSTAAERVEHLSDVDAAGLEHIVAAATRAVREYLNRD